MENLKQRLVALKPMLMGGVIGAAALAIIGFTWGGWVSAGTAEKNALQRATEAVTVALAPVCVDNFRRQPEAAAQLISLQKLSSYERTGFVEKGGWASTLGSKDGNPALARACAEAINKLKTADLG